MQYLGGKFKTRKLIVSHLKTYFTGQPYFEPFVGGAWIMSEFTDPSIRYGNDIHPDLIELYKAIQLGWEPPSELDEITYNSLKTATPSALRAFAGFGCSFGGKWFGGYARNSKKQNYALTAKTSLLKKKPNLQSVTWSCKSYLEFKPDGMLIYCDPPYEGTTQYNSKFNWTEFWEVVRLWSKNNTVIVSEYNAPDDFTCIASFERLQEMRFKEGGRRVVTEKLFKHQP